MENIPIHHPVAEIHPGEIIEFNIPNNKAEYLDLSLSKLFITSNSINNDEIEQKEAIITEPKVNLSPLFETADIFISDNQFHYNNNYYYYSNIFENLMYKEIKQRCVG